MFILILASLEGVAQEDDSFKENLLHKIYQKYHAQPTSQDVWEKVLSQRQSQEYKVVKGDTLWDLSRTLFGDGFFWSKVWSLNPYITNPHQISVGQTIHFFPGIGLESPGLQVGQGSKVPTLSPHTPLSNTKWWLSQDLPPIPLDLKDVTLPPPTRNYPSVLEEFPPSLPNWYFQSDPELEEPPLEIIPTELKPIENIMSLPYFISELPQAIKGHVYEIEKNAKTATERDVVFIDADEDLKVDATYTVIQKIGRIRDPDMGGGSPKAFEVQGELKIVGTVEGLYKAIVVRSLFPIQVGAFVIPGNVPTMDLSDRGETASIKGMIIGGENDTTRTLFGPQSIVFINRGSGDGVKVNQKAPIMAVHRLRHAESGIFSNSWYLGEIKIVKVEKNYSTAVIIQATDGVMPGDMVGELEQSDITDDFKNIDSSIEFGDIDDDSTIKYESGKNSLKELKDEDIDYYGPTPEKEEKSGAEDPMGDELLNEKKDPSDEKKFEDDF